jgi:hypothetical protein
MPELILPGVYVEVRPEALIVPGPISVGNIGIVGTARQGPVGEVKVLGNYAEARELFGAYDPLDAPESTNNPLTLVRALEVAYANGASTVLAVRAAATTVKAAAPAGLGGNATFFSIEAKDKGTAGNAASITIVDSPPSSAKITLKRGDLTEEYTVTDGNDLVRQVNQNSVIATAKAGASPTTKPVALTEAKFVGGDNGAAAADTDYATGFEVLLNEDAHIIVAAGLDDSIIGDQLLAHVTNASTDKIKRDRIAVIGSRAKGAAQDASAFLGVVSVPAVTGDRIIFVTPGIKATDASANPPKEVTLPGSYTAAAIAGMLSARDPHISLTNKPVAAAGLEVRFTPSQLEQLVKKHVLAVEQRNGLRVVKGITTDSGAFQQITTRRIVDYAKFGVRSAAEPYIGLLNNDRVRKALKGSINGFLAGMVDDEMLESYELDVTATRDEEIRGIAKVTMTLRPTFSIDYIKVVMFLG